MKQATIACFEAIRRLQKSFAKSQKNSLHQKRIRCEIGLFLVRDSCNESSTRTNTGLKYGTEKRANVSQSLNPTREQAHVRSNGIDLRHATTSANRCATVPGTSVRLLTQTSKMPGPSWSLPAHRACPRANGTICDACYASKGCYRYSTTQKAQHARFAWTVESMRTPVGRALWVERMVSAIRESGCRYFRVHDSGDLFNVAYTQCGAGDLQGYA
jgi:hypothetical protein